MLDIEKARTEILEKSSEKINEETAWTWASRGVACILESRKTTDKEAKDNFRLRAVDFIHEALEHAAVVGNDASFVQKIRDAVSSAGKP